MSDNLDLIQQEVDVLNEQLSKMNRKQRRKKLSDIRRIIKRSKMDLKKSK